jgi:hypothetical protein
MTDILIPRYPGISYCDWIGVEVILPNGYQHRGSVERPLADGNIVSGKGEMWDLGQNQEGKFRLFRRGTGEFEFSHVGNGVPLSPADLAGFGLTREDSPYLPGDSVTEEGDYSGLSPKTILIP